MNQRFNPPNEVFLKTKGSHRNILIMFLFAPQMQQLEAETHNHIRWTAKAVLMTSDSFWVSSEYQHFANTRYLYVHSFSSA